MAKVSGRPAAASVHIPTLRGDEAANRPTASVFNTDTNDAFFVLIALALCVQWAVSSSNFAHVQWPIFAVLLASIAAFPLALARRRTAGLVTLGISVAAGVIDRAHRTPFKGSDVVDATKEALNVTFAGANPYFHVFMHSRPIGSPFPYLPGELFFYALPYALYHSITRVDQVASIAVIFCIASLAPIVGAARVALSLTLFTTFTFLAKLSVDGSNEHALAFLLVATVVTFAWSEFLRNDRSKKIIRSLLFVASAVFLTMALLFKALSWFFVPFIIAYVVGRYGARAKPYLALVAACTSLAVIPFLWPSPLGLLDNVYAGFVFHQTTWGLNVWNALDSIGFDVTRWGKLITVVDMLVVVATFSWLMRKPPASLGGALMSGLATTVPALLLAHWSTAPYFTFATTLLTVAIPLTIFGSAPLDIASTPSAN